MNAICPSAVPANRPGFDKNRRHSSSSIYATAYICDRAEAVVLLGILDDHSRLACHAQWYWNETAESLAHGLSQGFLKRGLPRSLLSDNGSAMIAAEICQGLQHLGIV